MRALGSAISLLAVLFTALAAQAQPEGSARRFALIVGANDGGPDRVTLRYAAEDARSFASVMDDMGGLAQVDTILLTDPDRASIADSFAHLQARIAEATAGSSRLEFFFYYSGHSDEVGLLLPDGRLDYQDVRGLVHSLDADVRIGIFDSCASGAFVRIKGGQRQAPFLVDESSSVRGHAYLTSSSAEEAAQESDAIGASFFTHFLVSGLRGAADTSGDRRVTLNEAYRFAFDETLARTESTWGGPQHPGYEFELVGRGDIVLTDLNETSATLSLDVALQGRFFVRDASGSLVAELFKPAGRRVELGLAPGRYDIRLDSGGTLYAAAIDLEQDVTTVLDAGRLVAQSTEGTTSRGPAMELAEEAAVEGFDDQEYRHIPFAMALITPLDSNSVEKELPVLNNFAFNWLYGESGRVDGVQISLFGGKIADRLRGVQVASVFGLTGGDLRGWQVAGAFNRAGGMVSGLQLAGGIDLADGDVEGIQAAGGLNVARASVLGSQIAGGGNVALGTTTGFQVAGGFNYSPELTGAQVSPINIGRDLLGVQAGVVNVSSGRVRGLQLGLVNYADEADFSIGLVGATRAGGFHPVAWTSDTAVASAGMRTDATYTYTTLSAGMYPFIEDPAWLFGAGVGIKFPRFLAKLAFELDFSHHAVLFDHDFQDGYNGLSVARLLVRWDVVRGLSFFGGPALNVYVGQGENRLRERPGFIPTVVDYEHNDDLRVEVWPGFSLGISLL